METPVNKIINSWHNIEKLNHTILLLGYGHTGRTTFAELVKKYKYNNPSQDLIFETGKYTLQGTISSKSIKLQTLNPIIYEKSHNDKSEVKILDVPSFALAPQSKKWTVLEQKLTLKYMIQKNTKAVFLVFVDEKNTRSNVSTWKKSVQSFLEMFHLSKLQENEQLLSSVAMIITKCPPQVKQETMLKRLKMLQTALEKDKLFEQALIDKFFKILTDNNNILIFQKVSGDQRQRDQTLKNYEMLEKIPAYKINPKDFKELIFTPEEEKFFIPYFTLAEQSIKNLGSCVQQIIQLEQFTASNIKKIKTEYFPKANYEMNIMPQIKRKFNTLKKDIDSYLFIQKYSSICKTIQNINSAEDFLKLMEDLIKLNIFIQDQDQLIFQIIFEAFQFNKISAIKMIDHNTYFKKFLKSFSPEVRQKAYRRLIQAEQGITEVNEKKKFYEYAIESIGQLKEIPEYLSQFNEKCKLELVKFKNPREAIKFLLESMTKAGSNDKKFDYASQIAFTLKIAGLYNESASIYRLSKNPYEAIQCFRQIFTESQLSATQYLDYLLQINLFEDAKRVTMEASARFGYKSRLKFGYFLKRVQDGQRSFLKDNKINILLEDISNKDLSQIKKIAQQAQNKL